ncbi:MAG: hypothetical protein K9H84_02880, partial [Bacteroidales bacterium]|nr:hypothetical protein [Bacteroidales bacterium]
FFEALNSLPKSECKDKTFFVLNKYFFEKKILFILKAFKTAIYILSIPNPFQFIANYVFLCRILNELFALSGCKDKYFLSELTRNFTQILKLFFISLQT